MTGLQVCFPDSNSAKALSGSRSAGESRNNWYTLALIVCYLEYEPSASAASSWIKLVPARLVRSLENGFSIPGWTAPRKTRG